jgi:serine/threonine protein kinase
MSGSENPNDTAHVADPMISQVVADRYRVLRKLGEGGMGAVYLAEHIVLEKKIALKVLAPELARKPELVARFLQEARSASRIGHENVIDISDFGQSSDGCTYIAMEYLDGKDLGEIVREKGALDWEETREIVLQICRALRAAHDKGIVHRDMKPENIFLIQREDHPHFVKILDFGIAKVMGLDPQGPRLTRTGMIFGTPEYMAPEQAEGKETDHRADIYAVGCILYHLITGQTPFVADSFMLMLTKQLIEDPVPPSARRPDLPISPAIDALVLKALEKNRDRRWQSMADLIEALGSCLRPMVPPVPHERPGTQILGGGNSQVAQRIPEIRSEEMPLVLRTDLFSDSQTSETFEEPPRRSIRDNNKTLFILLGITLGVGGALWLFFSRSPSTERLSSIKHISPNKSVIVNQQVATPPPLPTTPDPFQESPADVIAPMVEMTVPSQVSEQALTQKPAMHGRKAKTPGLKAGSLRTKTPVELPSQQTKPLPPPPRELKPFPVL